MGTSRAYLDSYYLLAVVFGRHNKAAAEHLLYTLSRGGFEVLVPQTVLGETVSKILARDGHEGMLDKLDRTLQKYGIDARRSLPPAPKGAFAIMEDLRKRDERLDATDTMILAQMMADPYSKFLFTKDTKMLYSKVIKEHEQKLRSRGLRNEKLQIIGYIRSS